MPGCQRRTIMVFTSDTPLVVALKLTGVGGAAGAVPVVVLTVDVGGDIAAQLRRASRMNIFIYVPYGLCNACALMIVIVPPPAAMHFVTSP